MIAMRRTLGAVTAVALLAVPACAPTLAHPMRVKPGLMIEAGSLFVVPVDVAGCDEEGSCGRGRNDTFLPSIPTVYGSVGWGAVVDEQFGLLVGVTAPARVEYVDAAFDLGIRAFGMTTLQREWGSVGLGAEIGIGGASLTLLGEAAPWPDASWAPRLGIWARGYTPYEHVEPQPAPGVPSGINGLGLAWEVGPA